MDGATVIEIDDRILDRRVHGVNLRGGALREELGSGRLLLVFLRHFG